MSLVPQIVDAAPEIIGWRRHLHSIPELGFEEHKTSAFVQARLREWGIPFETLAGTGVVATLRRGGSNRAIGIRADMDALPVQEETGLAWASQAPGVMHACGHDGHTAGLLAAARHLALHSSFDGTVHFIFQPAEEGKAGAKAMIEAGLFDRFACDMVFGAHNDPTLDAGLVSLNPGPVMAASDTIRLRILGSGGHAARPHLTIDPIAAGAAVVEAIQRLVARRMDSLDSAVISITEFRSGNTTNVIPDEAILSGTMRTLLPGTRTRLRDLLRETIGHTAAASGAVAELDLIPGYPALINDQAAAEFAAGVCQQVLSPAQVLLQRPPSMGSEDFAFMAQARPAAFLRYGTRRPGETPAPLHSARYDFNDDTLPLVASLWVRLAEARLVV